MIDLSVAERRRRARQLGASTDDQPLLLTCNDDVRWCSGFTGSNGWLLLDDSRTTLLTDGRYVDQENMRSTKPSKSSSVAPRAP